MRRSFSLFITILFLINNLSFGLSVPNTSGDMDPEASKNTKDLMCMMAESQYLQRDGKWKDDEPPILTKTFKGTVSNSSFKEIGVTFLARRLKRNLSDRTEENPYIKQELPNGDINPIYKIDDLIEAFKYFRDNEAEISPDFLDIKEGYFPMKENTFIPARIEKNPEGSGTPYTLVIHTEFVQMWNHIRKNDVWFEKTFKNGENRIISIAWGLFYRVAKHEMADLTHDGKKYKGGGHAQRNIEWDEPATNEFEVIGGDEEGEFLANKIGGKYADINDDILLWFAGAYLFMNKTRYNNDLLEDRIRSLFDQDEENERISNEKPISMDQIIQHFENNPDSDEYHEAMLLIKGINQNFFSNAPYSTEGNRVKPRLKMPDIKIDQAYIKDYEARKQKNGNLDKEAINMFGKEETREFPITILFLDDESSIRKLMSRMLERQYPGCKIITCENGQKGLETLKTMGEMPDIILTDINMPVMNGIEFLTEFAKKENFSDTKIFVISGRPGNDEKVDAVVAQTKLNYGGYLVKPFSREELDERLTPEIEKIVKEKKEAVQTDTDKNETVKEDPITVLVVDDERGIQEYFDEVLKELGFNVEVVLATNGEEALKAIEEMDKLPGIIMTDMMMPVMDGSEFLNKFKKLEDAKDTQVILMTGSSKNIFGKLPKDELSLAGLLSKPFNLEKLMEIVVPVLEKVRERQKNKDVDRNEEGKKLPLPVEEVPVIEVEKSLDIPVMVGENTDAKADENKSLDRKEKQAVWTAVNMFREENIEILLPQSIHLDGEVVAELVQMKNKYGNIRWQRYSTSILSEEYIGKILADRKSEDYRRVTAGEKPFKRIVITDPGVNKEVKALAFEGGKAYLFKDVKVLQINMPKKFATDSLQRMQHRRLVQIAILTRLLKGKNRTPKIELVLTNIIKNAVGPSLNFENFMMWLGVDENDDTDVMSIKERLANLLADSMVINLVDLIGIEYHFIQEFKKYA